MDDAIFANDLHDPVQARKRELDAVIAVAAGDMETSLATVARFESELADWAGFAACVGTSSDTGGVSVMLGALDFRPGDEVIVGPDVPAWVTSPLVHAGLIPVAADYEPGTLRVQLAAFEQHFSERTRAVLVSSSFLYRQDIAHVIEMSRARQLVTIVELTASIDTMLDHRQIAEGFDIGLLSLREGDSAISTGEGGAVFFRHREWGRRAKSYSQFSDLDGIHVGVNHKISGIQCAVGRLRLQALMARNAAHRAAGYRMGADSQHAANPPLSPSVVAGAGAHAIKDSFYPVGTREEAFVLAALNSGIGGRSETVRQYEQQLKTHFNAGQAIATSSGYGSLVVALSAFGLKPGDKVLLTPTCPLCTVYALMFMRLEPVFCDISPDDFTIDLAMAERLIDDKTKAIIDIPMWGYPVDAKRVAAFARAHGLYYLLDIALAHKARLDGEFLWKYADMATFSTHHSKTLVTGEGGAVLTDNDELALKAKQFTHCDFTASRNPVLNFSLSGLQAALGLARLHRLEQDVQQRLSTMQAVSTLLTNPYLEPLPIISGGEPAGTKLLVRSLTGSNAALLEHQSHAGIPSDIALYNCKALYQYPVLRDKATPCPNAERMLATITTLPVHPDIRQADIAVIAAVLNRFQPEHTEEVLS
ncbi:DegT/DnrJ/EryC1/StrS family aminotransferase [Pectobacterium sp. A5351]|uniref:DegT/DnrJ/EryC1/StrS family aminotransferase n=1 Tax=Pectobacterium sp. A5351 TaxID=2914983 RepID=UPI00232C5C03|nr:DegT/DnrJ/EryC1/StrS family aminotransferase [Pectobacterium sp. A5351]WCG83755.1 DegT/DnrJ/EryC1/StrS family aminotransferase [Pectobacterium sp. A5351]